MLTSAVLIVIGALSLQAAASSAPAEPSRADAAPLSAVARGNAAMERGDWGTAIDALGEAERQQPLDPVIVLKLGTAHARAGHELPAIAWYRCYLSAVPAAPNRASLTVEILRLQLQAESRIKRILQEGSEGILEIGDVDPDTLAEVQQLAVQNALAAGRLEEANRTASAVEESRLNDLWAAVAGALASEGDFAHAEQAAARVTDGAVREALRASLTAVVAAAKRADPPPQRWEALARELSGRAEVVRLDTLLDDLAKADARRIPIRLMEIGSGLRGWFGCVQRLADELAPEGK